MIHCTEHIDDKPEVNLLNTPGSMPKNSLLIILLLQLWSVLVFILSKPNYVLYYTTETTQHYPN